MLRILVQGFLIGAAKMIPGFSGSLLAINFGVYEKALNIIANLRKLNQKKLLYLLLLGTGIIIGIIIFSYCVKFLLKTMYFPIMLLFIGLIIGGMQGLCKEIKKYKHPVLGILLFSISFFTTLFISLSSTLISVINLSFFSLLID